MTFLFGNLMLWPFLLLVAVPLLVHLFARSRPPVYSFSSIEFIRKVIRYTLRIKRPKDWLLLLIRTVLFAVVILLFLRPIFFAGSKLADPFRKKSVVLIVDATASMAYPDGAQTRFAAACAEASEILSGLSSRDTANVIWLKATPETVFPERGANFSYLQDALRRTPATLESGAIDKALNIAIGLLEHQEGRREICVLSDFQKAAWDPVRFEVPSGISLIKVKVGLTEAANLALTAIRVDPAQPLVGEDATLYCDINNYSPQPMRKTVFLGVAERRVSQDVMAPPWSKVTAVFKHRFAEAGAFPVTAYLSEDTFPADDRRSTVVEAREFLRVGILSQEPETAAAWRRALNAVNWIRPETLTMQSLTADLHVDALLLSGWDGSHADRVRPLLQNGCAVVCYPGRELPINRLTTVLGVTPPPAESTALFHWEQGSVTHTLKVVRDKDELFHIFTGSEFGNFTRATFRGRLTFPMTALPAGELLMAYDDQVPALIRFTSGKGQFYVWNMPLNPDLSTLAKRAEFLPFLAELLLTSRGAVGGDSGLVSHVLTGERVTMRLDRDVPESELALCADDGRTVSFREFRGAGAVTLSADQALNPGLYTWQHMGKPLAWAAVDFPVVESDLRTIPVQMLEKSGEDVTAVSHGFTVRQMRDGIPLWPYLLLIGVIAILAEGFVALWAERPDRAGKKDGAQVEK